VLDQQQQPEDCQAQKHTKCKKLTVHHKSNSNVTV